MASDLKVGDLVHVSRQDSTFAGRAGEIIRLHGPLVEVHIIQGCNWLFNWRDVQATGGVAHWVK